MRLEATAAQLDAIRLAIEAETALAYIEWAALAEALALAEERRELQDGTYQIVRTRVESGLLGYSVRFKVFGKEAWTQTAWTEEASRNAFVTVVGKRLKQSGMVWSVKGSNHLLAFRGALLSRRFDDIWADVRKAA